MGSTSLADTISNVTWVSSVFFTLGTQALLAWRDDALRGFPVDAVIIFETVFSAMVLNQTVKLIAGRQRPFVGALTAAQRAEDSDNNLSFYSGHSSFTMSLAVAAGTVTQLRGYRRGWLVWAIGVPLSLATGMLRIAADKHNFTDVAVGWAVGALLGFSMPWFFHGVQSPLALRLVPAPGGVALAGRF